MSLTETYIGNRWRIYLYRLEFLQFYMGWSDLKKSWKGAITGGIVGIIFDWFTGGMFIYATGLPPFLITLIFIIGGILGGALIFWIIGVIRDAIKNRKNIIASSKELQTSLIWKMRKFYMFNVPFGIFIFSVMIFVTSILIGWIMCGLENFGWIDNFRSNIAHCEFIPVLRSPIYISFIIFIEASLLLVYLVKKIKSLNEIIISKRNAVLSSIFGVLLWPISLWSLYFIVAGFFFS